jgi:hypothetical protein
MQKNQEGSWLPEVKIVVRSKLWHQMDATKWDASFDFAKVVGFTGWMQKSWIQKYPTLMTHFYPMAAGECQSAFRNWTNALLPDGYWITPKRFSKLDQCAFTRKWLASRDRCKKAGYENI